MIQNEVLYPQAPYFVAKKHHIEELNKKKMAGTTAGGGIENTPKLESIRFSSEISYLADALQEKLRNTEFKQIPLDDVIISKILTLIFGQLDKIWREYEIYLFPYIKAAKALSMIEDIINKNHKNNLDNIFHVLNCFFRGDQIFPDNVTEGWNKELTLKLNHLQ